MNQNPADNFIIDREGLILITGATGFIGSELVRTLLNMGFRNIRCLARSSRGVEKIQTFCDGAPGARMEVFRGNLLSREDCIEATKDVGVIFHLAAGRGEKSIPDAFANSVVTTRNLLDAAVQHGCLKRFVNISSFAVYSNNDKPRGRILDEDCPVERHPEIRGDAYAFAKIKQDELVMEYGTRSKIPYVIVRPGYVVGPSASGVTGRVGIGTFGIFLHLGGSNSIPFTYIENCAEAIALAGLKQGIDGNVFNVVDDHLPSSRQFLRMYKRNVQSFNSLYIPHSLSYLLCYLWEWYSKWSEGQLPPAFNRSKWHSLWKKTRYSNEKLKRQLGWSPKIPLSEGFKRYFEACRTRGVNA